VKASRYRGRTASQEWLFDNSIGEGHKALTAALRACQDTVKEQGRSSTQGRQALKRVRKLSVVLGLLDDLRGHRFLSDDPDLVSEEEAVERTRARLESRSVDGSSQGSSGLGEV
jgi:hypothetical protein